ncbi:glutathione S-transferase family protein [Halomonas binhaiensis]|uniref:glutathione transferase n=1 Tax=Halomonas binhaiensis TaxID=2562282 RepID=A0A5C1NL97_9GAMM|nr:glutathione S-transferase family protein [Halomonas binhaiensis]QEM83373.1 glutathione S-transferase family protein [Halomonas binhaiensis]
MAAVHILGPAFSNFVRSAMLVCEEKGIDYSVGLEHSGRQYQMHSPEHLSVNPFGKVPVLFHGERKLYETVAICRYLDAGFDGPSLQPADPWQRALVDQWCSALAVQVDQALVRRYLLEFVMPQIVGGEVSMDKVREAEPGVVNTLAILEDQLRDDGYLVGDSFTLADVIAAPMLDYLVGMAPAQPLVNEAPKVQAYVARLKDRASTRRVLVEPVFSA